MFEYEQDITRKMRDCGAIIRKSHFVYTSGRHGDTYITKDAIYPHTDVVSSIGDYIARTFIIMNRIPDIVVGPEKGAIILSQWTAHHLSILLNRKVLSVYAENYNPLEADTESTHEQEIVEKDMKGIMNIYTSFNNTLVHVTDMSGKTLTKVSGGMVVKSHRLESSPTAAMLSMSTS